MEFATGAMGTLLPKLGMLLQEELHLKNNVKEGIKSLTAELESMQAALVKVSDVPLDQLDPNVKIWANEVRGLSYDIEDRLDSFKVRMEGLDSTKRKTIMGFIQQTRGLVTKFKIRHVIFDDIKDFGSQVKEVKERYDRYKVHDVVANPIATTVDPRLLAMYNKVSDLVGIDEEAKEIMNNLFEDGDEPAKKIKTVSVVGFGGLGKTTLVKAVYDKVKKEFDCSAFVSIGQKCDLKKVFKDVLYDLDKQNHENIIASEMDEKQLIDKLQEFLADKRYLVVIDDIWDISTWKLIRCALVESNPGSRIIITTRICEVAKKVGGVYNKKPLSLDDSKTLFYTRVFAGESMSLDNISGEVCNKILRKCGGVPLSIITIASLLVGKQREDWSKVYDYIGFGHEDNEVIGNMRKILAFSYYNLPPYLKTCLLHLSIFPEDHKIEKNSLIWRWIAEGFVIGREELGLFEVGESYFNELINRSMIRWIELSSRSKIRDGCGIHDMVLDLIRTLSGEVNLVTVSDVEQQCTTSSSYSPVRSISARRLAFHKKRSIEHNPGTEIGQVRSFNAFNCSGSRMPRLLSFRVLRVLALENCNFSAGNCCLGNIGKLHQLRYLGLVETSIRDDLLPGETGRLKFLQTLDVRRSGIKILPASVGELRKLMCLRATEGTRMMAEIGKLASLEELEVHSVDKSPNFATGLGQLTKVRVLEIHFDEMDESTEKALMESLRNLRKIQSLQIWSKKERTIDLGGLLEDWTPTPSDLRQLMLCGIHLPRRPSWIDPSCVPLLSYLSLTVQAVQVQDLEILGRLPLLSYLYIWSEGINCLSYTATSRDEFQNLRHLDTNLEIMCGQQGALPMVEKLTCRASMGKYVAFARSSMPFDDGSVVNPATVAEAELPVILPLDIGWPVNMPCLRGITYLLDYQDCSAKEWAHVETLLLHVRKIHPNCPPFRIKKNCRDKKMTLIDAFSYLEAVKDVFKGNPSKYSEFLDLMIDYKRDRIKIKDVIIRLKTLFTGHDPNLILDFSVFLPREWAITLGDL